MSGRKIDDADWVAVAVLLLILLVGVKSVFEGDVEVGLTALFVVAGTVTVALQIQRS